MGHNMVTCGTYALLMRHKCYKIEHMLLMGHNVLLKGYVMLCDILYYICLGNFEGPTVDDARNNCWNIKF